VGNNGGGKKARIDARASKQAGLDLPGQAEPNAANMDQLRSAGRLLAALALRVVLAVDDAPALESDMEVKSK
jgi:hypothetical protein